VKSGNRIEDAPIATNDINHHRQIPLEEQPGGGSWDAGDNA